MGEKKIKPVACWPMMMLAQWTREELAIREQHSDLLSLRIAKD